MTQLALYRCWLDSSGKEHRVIAKQGNLSTLNNWAKRTGLHWKRDRRVFGGTYLGPSGEWYEPDIAPKKKRVPTKRTSRR